MHWRTSCRARRDPTKRPRRRDLPDRRIQRRRTIELDVGAANRRIVLENDVVFGSVNANRSPQETATEALDTADPTWLSRLLTRRIPLDSWTEGLERRRDDVKVVVQRN